jgi:hypothetical protein
MNRWAKAFGDFCTPRQRLFLYLTMVKWGHGRLDQHVRDFAVHGSWKRVVAWYENMEA